MKTWIHKIGSKGQEVARIQRTLGILEDGKYGPATEAAVMDLQSHAGLSVDGAVGPETRKHLGIEMYAGIDVSRWNNITNWRKLKESEIADFCWIKATEGNGYLCPQFEKNRTNAKAAGIPYGPYHFARPDLHLDPYKEVDNFVKNGNIETSPLRPVLDFETAGDHSADSIRNWVLEFLVHFEKKSGIRPVVYTGGNMTKYHLNGDTTGIDQYTLWHAWYNKKGFKTGIKKDRLGGWKEWRIWQWTATGQIPGSNGNIDRNWLVGGKKGFKEIFI